jgi:hypothetical protein
VFVADWECICSTAVTSTALPGNPTRWETGNPGTIQNHRSDVLHNFSTHTSGVCLCWIREGGRSSRVFVLLYQQFADSDVVTAKK